MNNIELIEQISNIIDTVLSDGIVSPMEINKLQDWLDENSVEFDGNDYNELIVPLQKFIEDGQLTKAEIDSIKKILAEKGKIDDLF